MKIGCAYIFAHVRERAGGREGGREEGREGGREGGKILRPKGP